MDQRQQLSPEQPELDGNVPAGFLGTYLDLKRWGVRFPVPEEDMAGFFRNSIVGNDESGHHDDDPHTHYGIVPFLTGA